MSWLETVRSIVTQTVVTSISAVIGIPIGKQDSLANPFGRRSYRLHLGEKETESANEAESDDSDEEGNSSDEAEASSGAVRITTRARITYELDRFEKNAMMVFLQIRGNDGCILEEIAMTEVKMLHDTFTAFRFEVNVHIDLTCGEIRNKCQEFFQQDFTQYGAVVVAALSFNGATGQLSALDGRFSDKTILRHMAYDINPTLVSKPKVYITEANRTLGVPGSVEVPLKMYEDVVCVHFPAANRSRPRTSLKFMCDNIKEMADTNDFVSILTKSVDDIKQRFPVYEMLPIPITCTFTKEMWLARSEL